MEETKMNRLRKSLGTAAFLVDYVWVCDLGERK